MSTLEQSLHRHPTLAKPLADMLAFAETKGWGEYTVRFKQGRVYVYFKTVSIEVLETSTRQSEDRAAITVSTEN